MILARMARILHIQSRSYLPFSFFSFSLWRLRFDDCRTQRLREEISDDALAFDFEF